jgi:hypothetical protein
MDLRQQIRHYGDQPITHQLMMSLLSDYNRPNAKIHGLISDGTLEQIRKGLYIAGPSLGAGKPESFLLANHILGPSYVSLESALSYYGLIPERVFEIASMTVKASGNFTTPMGIYTYTRISLPYYAFGIRQLSLTDKQHVMIASPEKALTDKIVSTSGIIFRSKNDTLNYLIENLRIDEKSLKDFNTPEITTWLPEAPKKESLSMLVKAINSL